MRISSTPPTDASWLHGIERIHSLSNVRSFGDVLYSRLTRRRRRNISRTVKSVSSQSFYSVSVCVCSFCCYVTSNVKELNMQTVDSKLSENETDVHYCDWLSSASHFISCCRPTGLAPNNVSKWERVRQRRNPSTLEI